MAKGQGRPRTHMLREVMNGIRYVQRYGIPWDAMPKDLPPGSICYDYWRLLTDGGHLDRINHTLVMADRERAGRDAMRRARVPIEAHFPGFGDRPTFAEMEPRTDCGGPQRRQFGLQRCPYER